MLTTESERGTKSASRIALVDGVAAQLGQGKTLGERWSGVRRRLTRRPRLDSVVWEPTK